MSKSRRAKRMRTPPPAPRPPQIPAPGADPKLPGRLRQLAPTERVRITAHEGRNDDAKDK
jgi:hypothetical protein